MTVYFDNAATTRPYDEVIATVSDYEKNIYANPSSLHKFGFQAAQVMEETAQRILKVLALQANTESFSLQAPRNPQIWLSRAPCKSTTTSQRRT
jgi:cysteine desulfurase